MDKYSKTGRKHSILIHNGVLPVHNFPQKISHFRYNRRQHRIVFLQHIFVLRKHGGISLIVFWTQFEMARYVLIKHVLVPCKHACMLSLYQLWSSFSKSNHQQKGTSITVTMLSMFLVIDSLKNVDPLVFSTKPHFERQCCLEHLTLVTIHHQYYLYIDQIQHIDSFGISGTNFIFRPYIGHWIYSVYNWKNG